MIQQLLSNSYYPPAAHPAGQTNGLSAMQSGAAAPPRTGQLTTDTVTLNSSSQAIVTYDATMTLTGVDDGGLAILRDRVLGVFSKQGEAVRFGAGDREVDLNTLTVEEARELVADDGYFGVEQTSLRIFEFAVGIAGGDPARLDAIREGVEKGFADALDAFGGWLPEISYDTYDAVMGKLDEWAGVETARKS